MPSRVRRAPACLALLVLMAPAALAQEVPEDPLAGQQGLPDLIPTNPSVETTDEREASTICTGVLNVGDAPNGVYFFMRLMIDDVIVSDKRVDKTLQTGHGESNICWEVRLTSGRYVFTIIADATDNVVEKDEENNAVAGFVRVRPTPTVELAFERFVVTPQVGKPDSTQTFYAVVRNTGDEHSNATHVDFVDESGRIARVPLPGLAPGESTRVAHATATNFRPVGVFVARAVLDPTGVIVERDETNNEAAHEYEVLDHPAPELVFDNVTVAGELKAFRGVRITAEVSNTGDRAAHGIRLQLVNDTGFSYGNQTRPLLRQNEQASFTFQLILPVGNHSLRVLLDPTDRVFEKNETDNEWALNLTIEAAPEVQRTPNLVLRSLDAAPNDPRPGESVYILPLIENAGSNTSAPTTVTVSVDDQRVGSAAVPALEPGWTYTAEIRWGGGVEDLYLMMAAVDVAEAIEEIDEADNGLERTFHVIRPASREPPPTPPTTPPPDEEPTTPTPPPTGTPPDSGGGAAPPPSQERVRVEIVDMTIGTRAVPGGVKGAVAVQLRNPTLEQLGRMTVTFSANGDVLKETLVGGIAPAGTQAVSSGELDLPAGTHEVQAEVRLLGTGVAPESITRSYTAEAGESEVPAPGLALLLGVACLAALTRRKR